MPVVDTENLVSVSDVSRKGFSNLVREAEEGREFVVLRNNRPVAMLVSLERIEDVQKIEDDLADLALAAARLVTNDQPPTALDEVLARLGTTREELSDLPD